MKVRALAFEILKEVDKGRFAEDYLNNITDLPDRDRRLLTQLVYGTIRYQGVLDKIIQQKVPIVNRIILRLAGYQLFFLTRIPEHAIVNESVNMAKKYGSPRSAGFINAILRKWCRTPPEINDMYSHPEWIIKRWKRYYGEEGTKKLCEFNNEIPPIYIRLNTLKPLDSEVIEQFEKTVYPIAYEIKDKKSIKELKGFKEGAFQVQDISGMYIVDMLNVKPGMKVLDVCAAPGGKTCYIAQKMQNEGKIIAMDVSSEKIKLIEENCKRLGIVIVETVTADGTKERVGEFDRILVDAPCSNTGVFRRRIEARWRLKEEDFNRLQKKQLALLENSINQLAPKGELVYSTCSIDPVENEELIDIFLKKYKDFEVIDSLKKVPYIDNIDGVFGVKLARYTG